MVVVSRANNLPVTFNPNPTSNAVNAFATTGLPVPGSNRLDGQQFVVRASGFATPNGTGNVSVSLIAAYPAGQYPNCAFTSSDLTSNVITVRGINNFVVGQSVKITGASDSSENVTGNVATANSTQFTVALTSANVSNAASNTGAVAVIQPVQIYKGVVSGNMTTNVAIPWMLEVTLEGDNTTGALQASGKDVITGTIDNIVSGGPTYFNLPTGSVNFAAEPPVVFTAAFTFNTANSTHSATIKQLVLEQ